MNNMPTVSPPESSLRDVDTLVERVAELERTQQQEDVQGFLDGNPTAAGLPSYVWRRTDGVWRIIVGQNTGAEDVGFYKLTGS